MFSIRNEGAPMRAIQRINFFLGWYFLAVVADDASVFDAYAEFAAHASHVRKVCTFYGFF